MKPKKENPLNKPRFVTDINIGFDKLRKLYGGFATFTPIAKITKKQNASDDDIVEACKKNNYHIITHNTKDFEDAPLKFAGLKVGIICINLDEKNYLSKFDALLRKLPRHDHYYHKLIKIGNEMKISGYAKIRSDADKIKYPQVSKII